MDTAIQKAQERISFVKSSEEEFHAYQMREMAMCEYQRHKFRPAVRNRSKWI